MKLSSLRFRFFFIKYPLTFILFILAIIFVGDGNAITRVNQWQEIARLKGEIDNYNRRFERDKKMLESLKNDPDAVRQVARERYYMKTANEDIFVIEDDEND